MSSGGVYGVRPTGDVVCHGVCEESVGCTILGWCPCCSKKVERNALERQHKRKGHAALVKVRTLCTHVEVLVASLAFGWSLMSVRL